MENAAINTDQEIWRETDDAYSPSIYVTEDNMIGISFGGTVYVKDVRKWHALAEIDMEDGLVGRNQDTLTSNCLGRIEPDPKWEYTQYLQILIEAHKAGHQCHAELTETIKALHDLIFKNGG